MSVNINDLYFHHQHGDFKVIRKVEENIPIDHWNIGPTGKISYYVLQSTNDKSYHVASNKFDHNHSECLKNLDDDYWSILRDKFYSPHYQDPDYAMIMAGEHVDNHFREESSKSIINHINTLNGALDEKTKDSLINHIPLTKKITSDDSLNPFSLVLNIVLGKAGVGKSYLINKLVSDCKKNAAVLAPTALGAMNINGETIHRFFSLPVGVFDPKEIVKERKTVLQMESQISQDGKISLKDPFLEKLKNLDLLIIDEISMVTSYQMDAIDKHLRHAKNTDAPFGGVSIFLFGDIFQLGPIESDDREANDFILDEYDGSYWFFDSHAIDPFLNDLSYRNIFYKSIIVDSKRHTDLKFLKFLDIVRKGRIDNPKQKKLFDDIASRIEQNKSSDQTTYVCATNRRANELNSYHLDLISEQSAHEFHADIDNWSGQNYPNETTIRLKKDSKVIFIRNDPEGKYINGETGKITEISDDNIKIKKNNGVLVTLERYVWEQFKYVYDKEKKKLTKEIVGSFCQFPIKLGWAITVHKSQGMTLDHISIDLSENFFQSGMLYTALSRVRGSSDIKILAGNFDSTILQNPPDKALELEEKLGIRNI